MVLLSLTNSVDYPHAHKLPPRIRPSRAKGARKDRHCRNGDGSSSTDPVVQQESRRRADEGRSKEGTRVHGPQLPRPVRWGVLPRGNVVKQMGIEARAIDGRLDVALEKGGTADRQDDGEDLAELAPELVLLRDEAPLLLLCQTHQKAGLRGHVPGDLVVGADVLGHAGGPEKLGVLDIGKVFGEFLDITLEFSVVKMD